MAKVKDITGQRFGRLIDVDEAKRRIVEFTKGCHPEVLTVDSIVMLLDKTPTVDAVPVGADLGWVLVYAMRHAARRFEYVQETVIQYITPLVSHLDDNTLAVLDKDMTEDYTQWGYGDPVVHEPHWRELHAAVKQERRRRVGISD